MRAGLATAVAVGMVLAWSPAAQAAPVTRCVGAPAGCTGTSYSGDATGLQQALDDSEIHIDPDLVRIGPGTYVAPATNGFNYSSGELDIQGDGTTSTIIKPTDADGSVGLSVDAGGTANSEISDLGVQLQSRTNQNGLFLEAVVARNVSVTGPTPNPASSNTGVLLNGHARLSDSTVNIPGELFAAESDSAGNEVFDSTLNAVIGVEGSVNVTVEHCRITAQREGVGVGGATATVDDSLLQISDAGAPASQGLRAFNAGTIDAHDLTIIGTGADQGVTASNSGAGTSTVNVDSSIIQGFGADLHTADSGPGTSVVSPDYTRFTTSDTSDGGSISAGTGNDTTSPPGFVNEAAGDFRLRFDSALIDAGDPVAMTLDEDLDGRTRVVDGDGDSTAVVDMGAFEYQRQPPTAGIIGPDSGQPNEPLTFTSRAADPDPGDVLASSWSIAGQPDTGATVVRSFAAPGKYPVTLTVTDPTGQTSTSTQTVTIADSLIPILRGVGMTNRTFRVNPRGSVLARKAKRGTTFRFSVSETSTMSFLIERRTKGRRVGSKCRKATRKLRKRKGCIRYVRVKAFTRAAAPGLNRVAFSGRYRLRGKTRKLSPARYRLTLQGVDAAGNPTNRARINFRVVR
jgi:hypothetical protein